MGTHISANTLSYHTAIDAYINLTFGLVLT